MDRVQFGQQIGKFQGVSFKLADMAVELRCAELLVLEAAWKFDQKTSTDMDMAMAKVKATEMLAMVADNIADPRRHGTDDRPAAGASGAMHASSGSGGAPAGQRHHLASLALRPPGG
ncbi:MAG: acyl-CoA dehydrogenase family protein [Steroidobacteraceae bacterium]